LDLVEALRMTFKHKLSARIARLRPLVVSVLVVMIAIVACELPLARDANDPVTRLVVFPKNLTLQPNDTTELMAVGFTAAGDSGTIDVNWSVTGGTVLSTQTQGKRHYGKYKAGSQPGDFKAVAGDSTGTLTDTATITVAPEPVASVDVAPASASIVAGQTVQLTGTPRDAHGAALAGRTVTWTSSNSSVASVNFMGLVSGATAGTATITATSEGQSGTSAITVTASTAPVASVTVTPASASVSIGGVAQLTATPKDASGNTLVGRVVTWQSSSPGVATVNSTGLVTGVAQGSATVTATSEGQSGTSAITVTVTVTPVASVTVTPASASMSVGGTAQLTATPKDASGNPLAGRVVTWQSSNTGVATVSSSGLVSGVAQGSATVTATSEGQSGTSAITVTTSTAPVASVTVAPASTDVFVGAVAQLTAIPKDASGNPLVGRVVTWQSSNTGIATVNATGLVTGIAQGSATVTATSEGQSGGSAITVNPLPTGQCGVWPAGIAQWVQPLPLSTGQSFYASPNGSDANPGTLAAPWQSLSKAASLQPGQTLFLRAGTYGARGTVWTFGNNGTASGTITVAGYPGDVRPVLLGAVRMTGQYIRLSGVVLDGPTGDVAGPGPSGEAILLIMSGSHTELSNSEVRYDYWHAGVGGDGGFDYRVIGNYVHDNGGYLGDYNDAQNNTSHGMYASPSSYGLIANNIFEHNDAKGWMARHDANHLLIVNNTIVGNGRFGIDLAEQSNNIIAANNVVQNNGVMGKGGGGIQMGGLGPYWQINNVYWNNDGSDVIGGTVVNPLIANPLLVTPSTGTVPNQIVGDPGTDNHLRVGSPAIAYADPAYAVPFDIVGRCRGASPDAGAYQH
jgi:parallel beta-helix repeat protein